MTLISTLFDMAKASPPQPTSPNKKAYMKKNTQPSPASLRLLYLAAEYGAKHEPSANIEYRMNGKKRTQLNTSGATAAKAPCVGSRPAAKSAVVKNEPGSPPTNAAAGK